MLIFKNPTYTVEICSVVKHQYVCLSVSIELPKCSHTVKYINTLPSKYIEYWKPPCSKYQNDREVLMDNFKGKRQLQRGIVEGISTVLGIFSPSECSNYNHHWHRKLWCSLSCSHTVWGMPVRNEWYSQLAHVLQPPHPHSNYKRHRGRRINSANDCWKVTNYLPYEVSPRINRLALVPSLSIDVTCAASQSKKSGNCRAT